MSVDVAIIGGGISGLTTAYQLQRAGHKVAVLERQVRTGGNAISERSGGFLMEHGPSSLNAGAEAAVALSGKLGLNDQRCALGAGVRYRYLVGQSRVDRLSPHPHGVLNSNYLSMRGRLRMLAECLVAARTDGTEESIADFWSRRFGQEFSDRVIDPLVGGLFAGSASAMSVDAVFGALLEMEEHYGSISRGIFQRRLAGGSMPGRRLFSWRTGMGALPTALAKQLGPAIHTGIVVRRIRATPGSFRVETGTSGTVNARAVVIATQPHVASTLFQGVDDAAAQAAAAISAPPLAVVFLGYRREQVAHPLDGLGWLSPSHEKRVVSGTLFSSTMFPGRAPKGHVALAAYVGGARAPELARQAPEELVVLAHAEHRELLGVKGEPVITKIRQWPRGLPQYNLGHRDRIATIQGIEKRLPGLFVTGNYFTGPAVATCIAQAAETADRIHDFLSERGQHKSDIPTTAVNTIQ